MARNLNALSLNMNAMQTQFYLIKWEMAFAVCWLHARKICRCDDETMRVRSVDCLPLKLLRVVAVVCVAEFRSFDAYNCHYLCNENTLNLSQLEHLLLASSYSEFWSGCNYLEICAELANTPNPHQCWSVGARLCEYLIFVYRINAMLTRRRRSPTKLAQQWSPADNDNDNVPSLRCFAHSQCKKGRTNVYK